MAMTDCLPTVNDQGGAYLAHQRPPYARAREKGLNMTNETLQRNVTDELVWDPKIDSEAIAVFADDGVVTLRGTVGSFRQKREAQRAAERVRGVTTVNNALDVRVLTEHRREDAEL
jgi:osmotically-inducible protein OsmY